MARGRSSGGEGAVAQDLVVEKRGLAKKLTGSVVAVVALGVCVIVAIYVAFTLHNVPDWGADTKAAMIELELRNIGRLATDKAGHTAEIFRRVSEGLLQLQAFGEQVLLDVPQSMIIDGDFIADFSGLVQETKDWEHSSWYITGLDADVSPPAAGSSLDGLLNRTALMDVPFRGMQRQEELLYLAALDDPSLPDDPNSSIAFQQYPADDMRDMTSYDQECDRRFDTGDPNFSPSTFDPRCRIWFQDARNKSVGGKPIFTAPYVGAITGALTVTPAAPVYAANGSTLLGVVGADMDFSSIENSIVSLRVVGDEGYAYLVTPTGGEVAAHPALNVLDGVQDIVDLEVGVDEDEFRIVVARMTEECSGSASYEKSGDTWLVSWAHETASGSGAASTATGDAASNSFACQTGGYIIAVTVSESALLEEFSKTEDGIRNIVFTAIWIILLVVAFILCLVVALASGVSKSLTNPVNQLVDLVKALNSLDFSNHDAGTWILNEVSCPEVEELMQTFKSMTTVIKFANLTLESGNVEEAHQGYHDALVLFTKLNNDRGVGIVRNNLGTVYTLQARALVEEAAECRANVFLDPVKIQRLMHESSTKYEDAITSFRLAIEHAEILVSSEDQRRHISLPPTLPSPVAVSGSRTARDVDREEMKEVRGGQAGEFSARSSIDVLDVVEAQEMKTECEPGTDAPAGDTTVEDHESSAALSLQLANRKFNLALCLAAKAAGGDKTGGSETNDSETIDEACRLLHECEDLAVDANNPEHNERRIEYLLSLAEIRLSQKATGEHGGLEALENAEKIVATIIAQQEDNQVATYTRKTRGVACPPAILQQRLFAARGACSAAAGCEGDAVEYWTRAIVGCGDVMDVNAVRSSLNGLASHVSYFDNGGASAVLQARRLARGLGVTLLTCGTVGSGSVVPALTKGIGGAMVKIGGSFVSTSIGDGVGVDLCFVMDCTGSMHNWIGQARQKLFDIISQTKKDNDNLELRVAFVGYRDFCDKERHFEGPFDFHSEAELPQLAAKLNNIRASGGPGSVADVAGSLKHATQLSWQNPVRLCILFADAPCHGRIYHNVGDPYPNGCPLGVKPEKMIDNLQNELGVDFYFIRIKSVTDKMVQVFEENVSARSINRKSKGRGRKKEGTAADESAEGNKLPKFVVHDLGSNDNRFLDAVVKSVKVSAGMNLRLEGY